MSSIINASTSSGLVTSADTSGTVEIQSNGSTKLTVASTGAYGQLVSGTAQASTSGTAIDFTGIPSWVKRITVMFDGVSTNGTSTILLRLGDSGGFESTDYTSTIISVSSTSTGSAQTTGFGVMGSNASSAYSGQAIISLQNASTNTWTYTSTVTAGGTTLQLAGGGKSLSGTLDSVRITTNNGTDTFDAGTINILYEG